MESKRPPAGMHGDPGLQPERTSLAWGRTLFAVATGAAAAMYLTQRRRYSGSSHGVPHEAVDADITAVLWTAVAGVTRGALGIGVVLAP